MSSKPANGKKVASKDSKDELASETSLREDRGPWDEDLNDENFQYEEIQIEPEDDDDLIDAFSSLQQQVFPLIKSCSPRDIDRRAVFTCHFCMH